MAVKVSEKRQNLRFPVALPVDFGKADYYLSTICYNLSQDGVFVETSQRFALGERVCLFISLPNQTDPAKAIGEVMWTTEAGAQDIDGNDVHGIGLRFVDSSTDDDSLLKGYLTSSDSDRKLIYATEENNLIF